MSKAKRATIKAGVKKSIFFGLGYFVTPLCGGEDVDFLLLLATNTKKKYEPSNIAMGTNDTERGD